MVDPISFFLGSIFGLITFKTIKIVHKIYPYFINNNFINSSSITTNKIAIISGSTDGLGKAFTKKLYQKNYKLILLGRSEFKIQNLAKELHQIKPIISWNYLSSYKIDFSSIDLTKLNQNVDQLKETIERNFPQQNINTQILFINCCGDAHISRYQDIPLLQINRLHSVNLNSFHLLTQTLFKLKKQKKLKSINSNKEYVFVNVSSGVDFQPNRYSSIYSGTKAYMSNIMKVLTLQNQQQDFYFLNLTPLYIKTKMIRYLKQSDVVEPQQIVEGAFKLIKRKKQGSGSLIHELIKQFPILLNQRFNQRVLKALQVKNKLQQMQLKRKQRKNKTS